MAGSTLSGGYPDLAAEYATRSLRAERNPGAARIDTFLVTRAPETNPASRIAAENGGTTRLK